METKGTRDARFSTLIGIASVLSALGAALLLAAVWGCSEDGAPPTAAVDPGIGGDKDGPRLTSVAQIADAPPPNLVTVSFGGGDLTLWPYTGVSFDGTPSDPINLLFVGKADPVKIRSALLRLDGDRTAFGFPPTEPFNQTWSDAMGDVHTTYADAEGWLGSVIQLQLGDYEPARVHLRLWRSGEPFGEGGVWTVGAAHFEVLIPGTADHEVLSWDLAEQIVLVDLMRSGLLDTSVPAVPTEPITQTPSYRTIHAEVYNELPEELKAAIGGPPGDVGAPVPILNDGRATILNVAEEGPLLDGTTTDAHGFTYNLVIPKPFCVDSPLDYVLAEGPVTLSRNASVDASGRYQYHSRITGRLTITPVDVTVSPPVPAGTPFEAVIGDLQQGSLDLGAGSVLWESKRIAPQKGGSEMLLTRLRVGTRGEDSYTAQGRCP